MWADWLDPDYQGSLELDIETDTENLLVKIKQCSFANGVRTAADEMFEQLRIKYGGINIPLKILSDVVNKHISDSHVLEGILHILSDFDYSELAPFGISIVLACSINRSPRVQNLVISCVEKWQRPEFIPVLESLATAYRHDWIEKLKLSLIG